VKNAVVQVLARQTTKRKNFNGDSEIWTAPVVLTIQERGREVGHGGCPSQEQDVPDLPLAKGVP